MNVLAKFHEIPLMILQDIEKTKRYGHMIGRTDNVKTAYARPQTQFAGGIIRICLYKILSKTNVKEFLY